MAVTFDEAREAVLDDWPDYDIADYGYESDDHWFLILLPERAGGRIPAVAKASGDITWINENAEIYTQERPVGKASAATRSLDDDSLRLRGIITDRAAGKDITPGHDQLHHYWTRGKGLARWRTWTELLANLVEEVHDKPLETLKTWAAAWFHERYGFWPGDDKNRVMHGKPPRGKRIGPG